MKKILQKTISILTMAMLTFAVLFSNAQAQGGDPVAVLQSVADEMIAALKAHKTTLKQNRSLVYSLANSIIVPHADLDEMSKRVLPPRTWNSATSSQRSEFQRQFTTVLVRTYASALANYRDQTVKFFPVRGGYQGRSTVTVNSQIIRTDGPPISVVYRVVQTGSGWKLYDMTVEGVSLLESFRSQFADQLARGDMASLIQVLKDHNHGR